MSNSNPVNILSNKFEASHRYENFGEVLMRMNVKGFRCHSNTIIDIRSPITAFCGLNGTGKSTLLQLAATAYRKCDQATYPHFSISDFLVIGTLDPMPFTSEAKVEYNYWQHDRSLRTINISRNDNNKNWQGYSIRPEKRVFFARMGSYLPKIEQSDFTVRHSSRLAIESSEQVSNLVKEWTCKILSCSYETIQSNTVTHSHKRSKVISVKRNGREYSESHMGYGEARSQYLINALELLPNKSLVLIEEPEISLHQSAQYNFGKYLIDVASRKGHQIFLTTHSEFLLESLPTASRIYLEKSRNDVKTVIGLTAIRAKSLMSIGHSKALDILVEDKVGKEILVEILRRIDNNFLRCVEIYAVEKGANEIKTTLRVLNATRLPVAAVLDGDMADIPKENIFKLPGTLPPEKEIFGNTDVKNHVEQTYKLDWADFESNLHDVNHHNYFEKLSSFISKNEMALVSELAKVYTLSLAEIDLANLCDLLKEATNK